MQEHFDNQPTLIISGSGRSGTTWVLDTLAAANELRTVFEPLHPKGVGRSGPFANQYVPGEASSPDLKVFMDKLFAGRMHNLWSDYRIRPDRLMPGRQQAGNLIGQYRRAIKLLARYWKNRCRKRMIVKFIRANLMLGWLSKNYHTKIVQIVRHPGAVIASKMKLGGADWDAHTLLQKYLGSPGLHEDYLQSHVHGLPDLSDPVAAHTAVWCIENMVPMSFSEKYGVRFFFYEELVARKKHAWKGIVAFMGLDCQPADDLLSSPSQQVSREMKYRKFNACQLTRWMRRFDPKQRDTIDRVLDAFQVRFYRASQPMPLDHRAVN